MSVVKIYNDNNNFVSFYLKDFVPCIGTRPGKISPHKR